MRAHAHLRLAWVSSSTRLSLFFETGSLTEPRAPNLTYMADQEPWDASVSPLPSFLDQASLTTSILGILPLGSVFCSLPGSAWHESRVTARAEPSMETLFSSLLDPNGWPAAELS